MASTADEVDQREEREINPAPQRMSLTEIADGKADASTGSQEPVVSIDAIADGFRARIETAETLESASAVGNDINEAKATLGTALFTELKNKATRRYHQVNAKNKVDAVINSLPQPGEPDAAERFAEAERTLAAAKRHLGDELHDKYSITLTDMKPEYVG